MWEIKFREREDALKLRKEFGKLRKEKKYDGGRFIANCMTLGTRVRLKILKSIAWKCSSLSEDMYVHGFTSRLVLQVIPKNGGTHLALTFVDVVVRYGSRVKEADLVLAYKRVGTSFDGEMRQNFVVLTDKGVRKGGRQPRGVGNAGQVILTGGNKRDLEEGKDNGMMAKNRLEVVEEVGLMGEEVQLLFYYILQMYNQILNASKLHLRLSLKNLQSVKFNN